MDRTRLLAGITATRAQPDDVLYLERHGEDYSWCFLEPDAVPAAVARQPAGPAPDAWMFYSGPWPIDRAAELPGFVDELLAEMESMCGGRRPLPVAT